MQTVILGPKIDLHTGVHNSFYERPPAGFGYSVKSATHVFAIPEGLGSCSPHRTSHYFEGVDFGPGDEIVHSPRWPVLNRSAWVADMDNLGYPVVSGRTALNPEFAAQFGTAWSPEFESRIQKRAGLMMAGYAHPSCKAVFFHTQEALKMARNWMEKLDAGEIGQRFIEKCRVLYPAQPPAFLHAVRQKWNDSGPMKIVFCGRDFESKNGSMALRILEMISSRKNVMVTYIGNLPESEKHRSNSLVNGIRCISNCSRHQVLKILRDSHILFHPSKFESLGIVFLEAAAAGMAIVCAQGGRMPALHEIFDDNGALFVDRGEIDGTEEENAFRKHLEFLVEHTAIARNMGLANYDRSTKGPLSIKTRDKILHDAYNATAGPTTPPLRVDDVQKLARTRILQMSSEQVQSDFDDYFFELGLTSSRLDLFLHE
jgi:hypothetical protein